MKKLYKVTVRGLRLIGRNEFYVLADNPDKAYTTVRDFLDKNDYGFDWERELDSVNLIASTNKFDSITMLFEEGVNNEGGIL